MYGSLRCVPLGCFALCAFARTNAVCSTLVPVTKPWLPCVHPRVQAAQIKAWGADGVICGSALVRALGESGSAEQGLARMIELARSLRAVL